MKTQHTLSIAMSLSLCVNALAHHGREFLLTQDERSPAPGAAFLTANSSWSESHQTDEFAHEIVGTIGVTPRLSITLGGGLDRSGHEGTFSTTPGFHLQLSDPNSQSRFRFAVAAGYTFAESSSHSHHHQHAPHAHGLFSGHLENPICGPAFGPDAPPCSDIPDSLHDHPENTPSPVTSTPTTPKNSSKKTSSKSLSPSTTRSSSSKPSHAPSETSPTPHRHHDHQNNKTIHLHGVDAFIARWIAAIDITQKTTLVLNLIHARPDDGEWATGYAVGMRHALHHDFSVSLEAIGDTNSSGYHEAAFGILFAPTHNVALKAGIGHGLTTESPDLTARIGLVLQFH